MAIIPMSHYYDRDPKRMRPTGGGRDYGGSRGGGGGRQGSWGMGPRPQSLRVVTNQYRLSNPRATLQYFLEQKCYRYHITIWDAVKVREKTDESIQKEESDTKRRTT